MTNSTTNGTTMGQALAKAALLYCLSCLLTAGVFRAFISVSYHFGIPVPIVLIPWADLIFFSPANLLLHHQINPQPGTEGWGRGFWPGGYWLLSSLYWGTLLYLLYLVIRWAELRLTKALNCRRAPAPPGN